MLAGLRRNRCSCRSASHSPPIATTHNAAPATSQIRSDGAGTAQQSRSLWDHSLAIAPLAPGDQHVLELPGPGQQSLLVRAAGYRKQGRALTIAVAENLTPISERVTRYQLTTGLLALAVLAGLLLVQRAFVRRAFRSLDALREDVRRVESGEIGGLREDVPEDASRAKDSKRTTPRSFGSDHHERSS